MISCTKFQLPVPFAIRNAFWVRQGANKSSVKGCGNKVYSCFVIVLFHEYSDKDDEITRCCLESAIVNDHFIVDRK